MDSASGHSTSRYGEIKTVGGLPAKQKARLKEKLQADSKTQLLGRLTDLKREEEASCNLYESKRLSAISPWRKPRGLMVHIGFHEFFPSR
ncbi:hypothetical protein CRG98_001224 [Punica granatum]|uniref:Uncharacterized protein n=1 Tax=Punica granatum TaxID=22663 RepID=A0A2I0LCK8_PUNGR|nr:hypothetical protein CRG98_001224 [Punica granatum]